MTEPTIEDQEARQRALDITTSCIVQAPAGSGKTGQLIQRFLALLARVEEPEEILAITFTRKAAAEMRNRVLQALAAADGPEPANAHARKTWQLARAALARDNTRDWQLRQNPNRLRIQTFDSLSYALARQLPLTSALGAVPQVTEDAQVHYQRAARQTLRLLEDDDIGDAIATVLAHLDNRLGQLETLVCTMLARRDQWLGLSVNPPDTTTVEQALRHAVEAQLQVLSDSSESAWLHELTAVASAAANRLPDNSPNDKLAEWTGGDEIPLPDWSALTLWQGLAQLLFTSGGEIRRSWDTRLGFPSATERGIDAEEKQRRKAAKSQIKSLADRLDEAPELAAMWAWIPRLPSPPDDTSQHHLISVLLALLLRAATELQLVFADAAEVDFIEIQLRALRALGEPETPTDLALSLDYRLRHLLVDEFQDTSSSQYRLLQTLTAGWEPTDGRTLFAVGDPMQSIYRFRAAEVGLYLTAWSQGIGDLGLERLRLSVNFRSGAGLVNWFNASFPNILPQQTDAARGAVPYAPATANDAAPLADAVQIHPQAILDTASEAQLVATLIEQALAETSAGQVAVLARSRSHLSDIAQALADAGITFQAVDIDPLEQRPVVRDLLALTRALLHPGDRLSWLTVLHAPWIGLTLEDLLIIAESTPRTIPARLSDPCVREALSDDARQRVDRVLEVLNGRWPGRGREPLRHWVEASWLQLGGLAAAGPAGEADALAFLALLEKYNDADGIADFATLDRAIERLYATPKANPANRVQLMTMHKSKGLEFDTVILPGLGRTPRRATSELLYWLERPSPQGGSELLMAPIRSGNQTQEPVSDYLRALNKDKETLESGRLLYVAVTRAQRRLHLCGHATSSSRQPNGKPAAGSLLEQLWPAVASAFVGLDQPPALPQDQPATTLPALNRLAADWRPSRISLAPYDNLPELTPPTAETTIEFAWASNTARHVGTVVHRQLEHIALDGITAWPASRVDKLYQPVRLALSNLGVDASALEDATDRALRALRNTLDDTTGRWILGPHTEARCEWPLTLLEGDARHYVIDRSFVDEDGVRWIVDYKTGDHQDSDTGAFLDAELARYRPQLNTYARIVHEIDPRPIRLALYFPLFADWRVWEYAPQS